MQAAGGPALAVPSQLIPISPSQILQLLNPGQVSQNAVPVIVIAPSVNGLSLPQPTPIQPPNVVSAAAAAAAELSTMTRLVQAASQPSPLPSEMMTELEEMQRNFPRRYGALLTLASAQIVTQLSAELTDIISSVSNTITANENADLGALMPSINEHLIGITNVANMLSISINSLNEMSNGEGSPLTQSSSTPEPSAKPQTQLEQVELKYEGVSGSGSSDSQTQEATEPSQGSSHKTSSRFVCSKVGCKRWFRRLHTLQAHLQKTHMESDALSSRGKSSTVLHHQCPVPECGKAYTRRRKLNLHLTTHTDLEWLNCSECAQRFLTQGELEKHQWTHRTRKRNAEKKRNYRCTHEGCEKALTKSNKLVEHRKCRTGEKPFVCTHPGCGAAYVRFHSLSNHQQKHLKLEDSSTEAIPMKVEESSPSTTSFSTVDLSQSSRFSPSPTSSIGKGTMSKWAMGAPSASALAETAVVVKGSLGACRYICPIPGCKRICPKLYKLREHLCRHTNERPIVCPECEATFVRSYDLTRHASTHRKQRTGDSSLRNPPNES